MLLPFLLILVTSTQNYRYTSYMKLIVGLGNPSEKYAKNKHNAGFIFVDALAEKSNSTWTFEKKFNALLTRGEFFGQEVIFAKPQTYMNNSGEVVAKLVNYFTIDLNDLIIVHDDVDLEPFTTKFKKNMGAAGHHGVEDIVEKLGSSNFWRLRIGVGRPTNSEQAGNNSIYDVEKFVLTDLSVKEIEFIRTLTLELF